MIELLGDALGRPQVPLLLLFDHREFLVVDFVHLMAALNLRLLFFLLLQARNQVLICALHDKQLGVQILQILRNSCHAFAAGAKFFKLLAAFQASHGQCGALRFFLISLLSWLLECLLLGYGPSLIVDHGLHLAVQLSNLVRLGVEFVSSALASGLFFFFLDLAGKLRFLILFLLFELLGRWAVWDQDFERVVGMVYIVTNTAVSAALF